MDETTGMSRRVAVLGARRAVCAGCHWLRQCIARAPRPSLREGRATPVPNLQFAICNLHFAILLRAVAVSALLLTLSGCLGARGDIELVEARLRQQQDLADRYARDLLTAEKERDAARNEADLLRRQIADAGQQAIPSELAQGLFACKGIEFNGLMSGGRDRDGQPGDDVLVAVFVPKDEHGDIVKLPGAVELEALDLNRPEADRQIGKWTFTAEEARKLWKSGAFSSGYQLEVPLTAKAVADKLILHAKLSTADGRAFDATHTVSIKHGGSVVPLAKNTRPGATGSASAAVPLAPAAEEPSGKAIVTPTAHQETKPVSADRAPRPTTQPLVQEPASPLVPIPSDDAFSPPADDSRNPFADPPAADASAVNIPASEPFGTATVRKPADMPIQGPIEDQPRPFPAGEVTSDNWTDATIPFLR
jgi:hypothetical protein